MSNYLLLSPEDSEKVQAFLKKYDEEDLTDVATPFPRFEPTRRFLELDEMTFEVGGERMTGAQVAEHNRSIVKVV